MRILNSSFLLLILLFLCQCASADAVFLSQKRYAPLPSPDMVTIFLDERDLPGSFEKIALIKAETVSGANNAQWKKIKQKCADIGANGVYVKSQKETDSADAMLYASLGIVSTDKMELVAFYYPTK